MTHCSATYLWWIYVRSRSSSAFKNSRTINLISPWAALKNRNWRQAPTTWEKKKITSYRPEQSLLMKTQPAVLYLSSAYNNYDTVNTVVSFSKLQWSHSKQCHSKVKQEVIVISLEYATKLKHSQGVPLRKHLAHLLHVTHSNSRKPITSSTALTPKYSLVHTDFDDLLSPSAVITRTKTKPSLHHFKVVPPSKLKGPKGSALQVPNPPAPAFRCSQ